MLDFKRNRLDYGELLIPPKGYTLDRGVATMFSASLDCLLSIPVALIYAQTLEGKLDHERFQLLEAIQRISKKVTVYHNVGKLHAPSRYNRLYAFLEDMLIPVDPGSAFTAFHPKLWILRYIAEDSGPIRYRVMVMSRNLTPDRNWDVGACLEGAVDAGLSTQTKPLIDFLQHLNRVSPFANAKAFLDDFAKVELQAPDSVKSFEFLPSGIPAYQTNPLTKASGKRLAVVAPFIDQTGLEAATAGIDGDAYLFSRRHELMKLPQETLARFHEIYELSELVLDGEQCLDEAAGSGNVQRQDLHAKLFVYDQQKQSSWVLGSSNATAAAMMRNVECMIRMTGPKKYFGVDRLLDDLLGPERDLAVFTLFSPTEATGEDPEAVLRDKLRALEYALQHMEINAALTQAANQATYNLVIHSDPAGIKPIDGISVSLHPLNRDKPQRLALGKPNEMLFENIKETEISQFLAFRIEAEEMVPTRFLVKVALQGLPASRFDSIYKSIVDSRDKFFEYLRFLLLDETEKEDLQQTTLTENGGGEEDMAWLSRTPIYEQLLVAASRSPKKLRRIDQLITRLCRYQEEEQTEDGDHNIVPQAFLDFWEVYRPLIPGSPGKPRAEETGA